MVVISLVIVVMVVMSLVMVVMVVMPLVMVVVPSDVPSEGNDVPSDDSDGHHHHPHHHHHHHLQYKSKIHRETCSVPSGNSTWQHLVALYHLAIPG